MRLIDSVYGAGLILLLFVAAFSAGWNAHEEYQDRRVIRLLQKFQQWRDTSAPITTSEQLHALMVSLGFSAASKEAE